MVEEVIEVQLFLLVSGVRFGPPASIHLFVLSNDTPFCSKFDFRLHYLVSSLRPSVRLAQDIFMNVSHERLLSSTSFLNIRPRGPSTTFLAWPTQTKARVFTLSTTNAHCYLSELYPCRLTTDVYAPLQ